MAMPAGSGVTGTAVVAGIFSDERAFVRRRRIVAVTGGWQCSSVGACSRCRKRRDRCFGAGIVLVALCSPMVVLTTMAHSTTAPAESKKCERPAGKREPEPVAAKPIHRNAPSVGGTVPRLDRQDHSPGADY